jgi:predicted CopG family antitoxin
MWESIFQVAINYICCMKTISLEATDELAERFAKLTQEEKRGLSEMIRILMEDKRTLRQVMDDISEYAQKQGMTPELLEQLLKEK